jgi:polyvinyl alcohol dehydrogenase (cytochrome)
MLGKHPATILTQSPVVYNGVIFIGTSSNEEHWATDTKYECCSFVGSMNGVDLKTGKVIWQTPMVPKGYTGGAIWSSTPAIDPKRGVVYITTGNNYTMPNDVAEYQESGKRNCLPIDDHIDSFLALDLKTGAIKWATRVTPFDTWNGNCFVNEPGSGTCPEPRGGDLDFGQGAMLYTATVNGEARDLLAAGQKSGMFWGIDRDSGKVVWGTQVGPGGQSGGTEWGSATDGKRLYIAITNSAFQDWPMQPPELSPPVACGVGSIQLRVRSFGRLPSRQEAGRSVRSRWPMAWSMQVRWIRRATCARSTPPRARSCGPSRRGVGG